MPINEALFAAMKAASYIKPNAGKSYKLQRVAEELIAKQAPANPKCRVEDISAPMADGYAVPLRVFTPLVAYGAPLPEALEESSANDTPVASAISAILPAVLPKVLPKIPIKESTSSGNTGSIPDDSGTEIPVITPHGTILFFHGGGWATGGINLYTQACAHMAVRLQRRVIAVEYRLAPEYRFPTAVEDCYEAARQLFAGELPISGVGGGSAADGHPQSALPTAPAGGSDIPADQRDIPASGGDMPDPAPDPDSIVLFGDSAGGNLAAAVSLMARDRGEFMPQAQMLLYPVVGNDYNPETSPFESVRTNGTDYILTAQDMADYIDMYRSSVADLTNPYFAPLTAHDLSNQPRTLVLSAEYCPLRDEDEAYARRLQLVNDNVSCYRIHDGIHGYLLNTSAVGLVATTYRIIEHFLDGTPLEPASGTGTTANAPEGGDAWQDVLGTD